MMGQSLHAAAVARKHGQWDIDSRSRKPGGRWLSPLSAEAARDLGTCCSSVATRKSSGAPPTGPSAVELPAVLTLSPPHKIDVEHVDARLKQLAASAPSPSGSTPPPG